MTARTASDPVSPNLKDAINRLKVTVRELYGSQAHAHLMRAATGSDVNAGQSIYQPSNTLTAQTQLRNILSSEEQPPADSYMNVTTANNDDVSAPSPPQICRRGGCGRPARLQSRFRMSRCCDACEDGSSHDDGCTRSTCAEAALSPSSTEQYAHRKAHPLTLNGSLDKADTSALIFTESCAIQQSIDQLPHNFMTTSEPVDNCLRTRIGLHDHEAKSMTMKVCGTFQEAIKSHWDSCASACFESSLEHCVPNSFVKLEKKIVTADGGCNSDGMAWRRYLGITFRSLMNGSFSAMSTALTFVKPTSLLLPCRQLLPLNFQLLSQSLPHL